MLNLQLLHRGLLPALAVLAAAIVTAPPGAHAGSLEGRINGLFGGLATSITPRGVGDSRSALPEGLREISSSLATFRALAPIPSATGAFRFEWDPETATFNRMRKGPGLADTAQTLGEKFGTIGVTYTRIDFDTLGGESLDHLNFNQPAFSSSFLNGLPCDDPSDPEQCDRLRLADDVLQTKLRIRFALDQWVIGAAYGLTDDIDVSAALSFGHADMKVRGTARLRDHNGDSDPSFEANFASTHPCQSNPSDRQCVQDGFHETAVGTGDLYIRGKWRFWETSWADLAASGTFTVPTGNADDFLGYHDGTLTTLLIASKDYPYFSPHLNLGYALRDGRDVSQALWIAGSDLRFFDRLIFAVDFLGFHDDNRDGVNDDVLQSAVGFKLNLFGSAVLSGNFQFPLNRDGLRADVIYTAQMEYTF